ncbi:MULTISPECIES: KamA family radical SAM protein [Butyricimonas]|uniref:KamA family radical SAM protein n=1 Tax=Butyricimonas TaxID=574697 RepID=UPI0007FB4498|nr:MULTISPECIES: KamA family protein [Butyricimonas]
MKVRNVLKYSYTELIDLFERDFPGIAQAAKECGDWRDFEGFLKEYIRATLIRRPSPLSIRRFFRMFVNRSRYIHDFSTGEKIRYEPIKWLWEALRGEAMDIHRDFLIDRYFLFKQYQDSFDVLPSSEQSKSWRKRWKVGIDEDVSYERRENRVRICQLLIGKIERRNKMNSRYRFTPEMEDGEKRGLIDEWWKDYKFHLSMAIRDPDELNLFLDNTLSDKTMDILHDAKLKGIPFFVTPYYLSLLSIKERGYDDSTIRSYVIYSRELVEHFGHIQAWEKEDVVEAGKPNAAGWLLPNSTNIHRRYPEVAIFIPDSMGRACGGLCALCQRMYDFQKGHLNFNLERLKPVEGWERKMERLMTYYEYDSQLRDILITGGDALMSQNSTLEKILDAVYQMAVRKIETNKYRVKGKKYAEIQRVRLGSRLLAYLPSRIDDGLIDVLKRFREKAVHAGIQQFFIQTHFESPLEITEEVVQAVRRLLDAGWIITNQLVFTVAASRRGHTARLREELNKIGVLTYYTFSVKGFGENYALFAPNSRSEQEVKEEKVYGQLSQELENEVLKILEQPELLNPGLARLLDKYDQPFLATDRNVMNLPGIGKSMTFVTVGLTKEGKRILRFSLDVNRRHSPGVDNIGDIYIVENKSIAAYLRQLEELGEDVEDYFSIWHYSEGQTEARFALFEYSRQYTGITGDFTNLIVES